MDLWDRITNCLRTTKKSSAQTSGINKIISFFSSGFKNFLIAFFIFLSLYQK